MGLCELRIVDVSCCKVWLPAARSAARFWGENCPSEPMAKVQTRNSKLPLNQCLNSLIFHFRGIIIGPFSAGVGALLGAEPTRSADEILEFSPVFSLRVCCQNLASIQGNSQVYWPTRHALLMQPPGKQAL